MSKQLLRQMSRLFLLAYYYCNLLVTLLYIIFINVVNSGLIKGYKSCTFTSLLSKTYKQLYHHSTQKNTNMFCN